MSRHQHPIFFERCGLLDVRVVLVASLIAIAGGLSPAIVDAADGDQTPPQTRFREVAPWLPSDFLSVRKLIAFEEHAHFVYLAGRSWAHLDPPTQMEILGGSCSSLLPLTCYH